MLFYVHSCRAINLTPPVQVARKVREREMQTGAGPEVCDSWDWLPEGFLRDVVRILDLPSLCSFRLACARWRIIADRSVEVCFTHLGL